MPTVYAIEGKEDDRGRTWTRARVAALDGVEHSTSPTIRSVLRVRPHREGKLIATVEHVGSLLATLQLETAGGA